MVGPYGLEPQTSTVSTRICASNNLEGVVDRLLTRNYG
jgi:hypothetical protein